MIYDTGANGVLFKSFLHHSASQNKQECVLRPAISQGFASARSARVRVGSDPLPKPSSFLNAHHLGVHNATEY